MKANQNFRRDDEAVSPVIGVILMVAITVVLAAVVFVLVNNLGGDVAASEQAAVTVSSPSSGVIEITLVRGGTNAPYDLSASCNQASPAANCATISINGVACVQGAGITPADFAAANFGTGGVVRITAGNSTAGPSTAGGGNCNDRNFDAGDSGVSVSVTLANTLIHSNPITVRA